MNPPKKARATNLLNDPAVATRLAALLEVLTPDVLAALGGYNEAPSASNPLLTLSDGPIDFLNENIVTGASFSPGPRSSNVLTNDVILELPFANHPYGLLFSVRVPITLDKPVRITLNTSATLDSLSADASFRLVPGEMRWIRKAPSKNVTGNYQTIHQAAPLDEVKRTGTVLEFDIKAEWNYLASGTWSVDLATNPPKAGVVVCMTVGASVSPPSLPAQFVLPPTAGSYVSGKQHRLMFNVSDNGDIIYTITPLS